MEGNVLFVVGGATYAVMVRSCQVTGAIGTMLFGDVEAAKLYCNVRWKVPVESWEAYLTESDPQSTMKLNGEGVRYCGWKYHLDETETLHIHLEQKVIEF